ncbi:hypothetical protein [Mucilaginibacter sp.]|uniref:hypothetical protein n=1 Tax=Mucilaginibacter sp. TaxID=1882438 RepID=UPI003D152CA2
MDLNRLNNIAYKIVCIALMLCFILGGLGFITHHLFVRGGIPIVGALIISLRIAQPATQRTWLQILIIFIAVVMAVGAVKTI